MLPSQFTPQIHKSLLTRHIAAWEFREKSKEIRDVWILPEETQLSRLLDIAFFASQHTEEGRTTTFSVEFMLDFNHNNGEIDCVELAPPIPYSPRTIAKLAQAIRPERTHLAVRPANEPEELEIWGLLHYGDKALNSHYARTPSQVYLQVTGIGELRLSVKGRPIYRFSRGQSILADGVESHIHSLVASAAPPFLEELLHPKDGLFHTADALGKIAETMLEHHHGGTLLIQARACSGDGLDIKYRIQGTRAEALARRHELRSHYRAFIPKEVVQDFPLTESFQNTCPSPCYQQLNKLWSDRKYHEAVAFVGRLSAVDGAVVLDERLGLIGFGAFVVASQELNGTTHVLRQTVGAKSLHPISLKEAGGSRHQSAIRFCQGQRQPAVAIVASQDGGLSLIGRQDNSVKLIQLI